MPDYWYHSIPEEGLIFLCPFSCAECTLIGFLKSMIQCIQYFTATYRQFWLTSRQKPLYSNVTKYYQINLTLPFLSLLTSLHDDQSDLVFISPSLSRPALALLGPLLTAGLPVLEAAFPQCRRYARHAFQGLLDCRADFLAPLPLFAWLLCASSQERISIRILRHIEMCPTTNSLSLSSSVKAHISSWHNTNHRQAAASWRVSQAETLNTA